MGIPVCFIRDFLYYSICKVQIEKGNRLGIILQITSQTWLPLKRYVYRCVVASKSRVYPFPNCLSLPLRSSMSSRSSGSSRWRFKSVLPIYLAVPMTWNITCTDSLPSPVTSRTYQGCLSLCSSAPWWHLVCLLRLRRWFRRLLSWRRRWYDVRRWGWCWHCPRIFIFIVILRCIFFSVRRTFQKKKNENCNNFLAFVFYIISITRLIW